MKEIIAVVRMNKVNATKKALLDAGVAGFTATKVMGRGKLVKDESVIADRQEKLIELAKADGKKDTQEFIKAFLIGERMFPRRMFTVLLRDEEVAGVVEAIMIANRTQNNVGDGKIFVLPVFDAVRVRTGETGEAAI